MLSLQSNLLLVEHILLMQDSVTEFFEEDVIFKHRPDSFGHEWHSQKLIDAGSVLFLDHQKL